MRESKSATVSENKITLSERERASDEFDTGMFKLARMRANEVR